MLADGRAEVKNLPCDMNSAAHFIDISTFNEFFRNFFADDRTGEREMYIEPDFTVTVSDDILNKFSHIIMAWHSKISVYVKGAFFVSPYYDVPSFYAYLATLVTTIFFVSRAETAFFVKYSDYYGSLNSKAPYYFVNEMREQMLTVMWTDILQAGVLQILTTVGMFSVGVIIFEKAGFGPLRLFGMGFCIGTFIFLVVSYLNLRLYTSNLEYQVLAKKPFVVREKNARISFAFLRKTK